MRDKDTELTIAIPKGYLHEEGHKYFSQFGINFENKNSRELVFYDKKNNVKALLVRPSDVNVYVEHGSAHLGIGGLDLLKEQLPDVVKIKDLGFGYCKLVLAVKNDSNYKSSNDLPANCKIATKFTKLANDYIQKKGLIAEVVKLYGSVELAPIVSLSDAIIDLVATGSTLKANNLTPIETILESTAFLIANPVSFKFKKSRIGVFLE